MPIDEVLSYRLTPTVSVGIVRNTDQRKVSNVWIAGDPHRKEASTREVFRIKVKNGPYEPLNLSEFEALLASCLFASRYEGMSKYRYKFRNKVPRSFELPVNVKLVMGQIERAFREGKENVESAV